MKTPWRYEEPIENDFYLIKISVEYSGNANSPFASNHIQSMPHALTNQTRIFKDNCIEWRIIDLSGRKHANINIYFFLYYH